MGWDTWIRTVEIAPSLTAADPAAVEALLRSGCRIFHIEGDLELLASVAPLVHRYDGILDVRLGDAELFADAIARGADSVTVATATRALADEVSALGCELGVTSGEALVEGVTLVSIDVDSSASSVEHARRIAASLPDGVVLEVVGDLDHDGVRAFYDAGATVIVVGRSIFEREDLPRAYRRLVQALA
jgi:voltage-gated potassium channel Kch